MDDGLGVGQVREGILHDLGETRAALSLIGDFEIDVSRFMVLLSLGLLVLTSSQVQLNSRTLFLLLLLVEGFLEYFKQILVHDLIILNVPGHLNEVDLLKMLVQ